jgi:hypothetical protein
VLIATLCGRDVAVRLGGPLEAADSLAGTGFGPTIELEYIGLKCRSTAPKGRRL